MTKQEMLDAITKEVVESLGKGMPYNAAFAQAAHAREIWHGRNKERYNYLFRVVRKRVKNKIQKPVTTKRQIPARQVRRMAGWTDYQMLAANDRD